MVKVMCNGETLEINGRYVTDCCESLAETTASILRVLEVDYVWVEETEMGDDE